MARNLLELDVLPQPVQNTDWLHIRSIVDGDSLDFRVSVGVLLQDYINEADVNNSIGGIVQLINDGSGNAALPAVSAAFLTNIPLPTATGSVLGGVRLLDSTTSTSGAGGGYAATPLSVRTVDLRVSNLTASQVANTPTGSIAATNVQTALNELATEKLDAASGVAYDSARLGGTLASSYLRAGVGTASQIVNTPAGNIAATNVQAALNELDTEKLSTTGTAANASQLGGIAAANYLRSGVATGTQIVNTPAGDISATTVQGAINELDTEKLSITTAQASYLRSGISTASQLVNTPAGNIAATNVQAALNELDTEKLSVSAAASTYLQAGVATASQIVNTPAGNIAAVTVQAALNELDTEKLSTSGTAANASQLGGIAAANYLRAGVGTASQIVNTPSGNIAATTVQAAINELDTEKLSASNGVAYDSSRLGGRPASDYMLTTGTPASAIVVTPVGGIASTDLQGALAELDSEKLSTAGTAANSLQLAGIAAASYLRAGVGTASQIVNTPAGNISATTVQAALNELDSEKLSITTAQADYLRSGISTASQLVNTPAGNIAATTVQAAINELDTEKLSTSGTAANSNQLGGIAAASYLRAGVATAAQIVNTPTGGIGSTTVQAAINELDTEKLSISAATAANISNAPNTGTGGTISATTVQAAINELDSEKLSTTGTAANASQLGGIAAASYLRAGVATASQIVSSAVGGLSSTNVQSALAELDSEKLSISSATAANIACTATSTTAALNVQDALAELASEKLQASNGVAYDSARLGGVLASNYLQSGAVPASGVTFTPAGGIVATTVQTALAELGSGKLNNAHIELGTNITSVGQGAGLASQGSSTVAVGNDAGYFTQGNGCVAVGSSSGRNSQGTLSVAVGPSAAFNAQGTRSVAVGSNAGYETQRFDTVAVGNNAAYRNQGDSSVAIGSNSGADQANATSYQMGKSVAVGFNAFTANSTMYTDGYATAVGYNASASGVGGVALGRDADASGLNSFAALQDSTASGSGSLSIGLNTQSTNTNTVAIGTNAIASASRAISLGSNTTCTSSNGINLGGNVVSGNEAIAIGYAATVAGSGAVGIGSTCSASGSNSSVLGTWSNAAAANSTVVGSFAGSSNTTYTNSTSIGYQATVTGPNQVQLGNSATVVYTYATGVRSVSDIRDKADVRDTELGLNFIQALRPVQYRWDYRSDYRDDPSQPLADVVKDGSKKRKRFHNGLIAQEVEQVCANLNVDFAGLNLASVTGGEDTYSIGYEELIAPMIKAIQELSAQVSDLKKQLADKPAKRR